MSQTELKLSGTADMYDEFDCVKEEEGDTEEVVVKEEDDSETDCYALENSVEQSTGNGKWMI